MRAECTVGNVNASGLRPEVSSYNLSLNTHVSTGAAGAGASTTCSQLQVQVLVLLQAFLPQVI